jgi:alkylhydroperoxidase/carboxymuconolactone decarboxylase family protein YurZ
MTHNDDIPRQGDKASAAARRKMDARRSASGNWNPDWEPFAKLDPAWTEKAIAMAIAPAIAGVLDKKTIELIGIALDASCTNLYAPGVRRHIQRALNMGATREEITAVLQLATRQGLHSMCVGAPILLEELEAFGQRDNPNSSTSTEKETP